MTPARDPVLDGVNPALAHPAPSANGELLNRVQRLRLDNQLNAGAKARGGSGAAWLPWALCLMLAVSWGAVGVRGYRQKGGEDDSAATTADPGAAKPAASGAGRPANPESGTVQVEVKGYLVPAVSLAVSPIDVAGQIVELNVKEGQFYAKGATLARIDPSSYTFAADEARQVLASAREKLKAALQRRDELKPASVRQIEKDQLTAQITEAQAQRDRLDDDLTRMKLAPQSVTAREFVQSQQDVNGAVARLEKLKIDLKILEEGPRPQRISAAEAEVAGAQADIKGAEARLQLAEWKLANCVIRAPISGTVLVKNSEKGNLVNPLAFAGGSGSVCSLADLSDLEADLEIAERDISKLKVGQTCRVRADAYPDRTYTARLDRIMPTANRAKSIVNVRVKIALPAGEEPGTYLKPEMGAVVTFLAQPTPPASPATPAPGQ